MSSYTLTLKGCGFIGRVGMWLAAFLDPCTRKQAVGVDGVLSALTPVVSGVPQGTVLGHVLSLVHIMNISLTSPQGPHHHPSQMILKFGEESEV